MYFLLPAEMDLHHYFKYSIYYSFFTKNTNDNDHVSNISFVQK